MATPAIKDKIIQKILNFGEYIMTFIIDNGLGVVKFLTCFLQTLANIFDNLSAGWFGAALIVPVFSDKPPNFNFWILIVNLFFGTVFMFLAYKIRKFKKVKKK